MNDLILLPDNEIDVILPRGPDSHILRVSANDLLAELFERHNRLNCILNKNPRLRDKIRMEIRKNYALQNHLAMYIYHRRERPAPDNDTFAEIKEWSDEARKNLKILREVLLFLHPLPLISANMEKTGHLLNCNECRLYYEEDVEEYNNICENIGRDDFEGKYTKILKDANPPQENNNQN